MPRIITEEVAPFDPARFEFGIDFSQVWQVLLQKFIGAKRIEWAIFRQVVCYIYDPLSPVD